MLNGPLKELQNYSFNHEYFQTGLNSLHLASKEGYTDIVKELVGHGADVNSKTKVCKLLYI